MSNLPIRRQENLPARQPNRDDAFKEQVAMELLTLVTDSIRTGVQVWQGQEYMKAKWEDVKQQVALIEANARPELERLEKALEQTRERKETLRVLLDSYARLSAEQSQTMGPIIGKAIEKLFE